MRRTLLLVSLVVLALSAEARTKLQGYSGHPSCTVTVFKTGTATNATLYSNATGTAKSNSFTADADGFYFFYVDNGSYDIQFSGSGFTTFSFTDIRVAEAGVTSNVLTFGAKCDGSTDDTAAIQRAIDIAAPNRVVLPIGTCKTTGELLISQSAVTLEGQGPSSSILQFEPMASPKAAIRVDAPTATTIAHIRLKGFSMATADTTRVKIGIDIVDGSETVVEDVAIGTQDAWQGGTSVSPFTGTGSIGIRLAGRDFGTFRNVRSCGAIPLYIANNPNFASIDLDHHNFDGFYFIPHGDNPSVYVENDTNLTNVIFQNGAFVLGGAGFYWPDTTSTGNSVDLTFRNVRGEQFSGGYLIYITKNSPLRGLRIQDLLSGSPTDGSNGVYLHGVTQAVFDTYNYNGVLECLNIDSPFEWRNSLCQSTSTANLNSLAEVWAEGLADSNSPMPYFGRWESAAVSTNFDAGLARRYMGVYQLAKTGTLASNSTVQIPSRYGGIVLGRISIAFKGATKSGSFTVAVTSAGAAQESTTDLNLTGVGNVANRITVHWSSPSSIVIRNNLGETVTYSYSYFWN